MNDRLSLDGRVALVTGGAGGIGAATCRLLAERGARVVVADLHAARAHEIAREIGGLGLALDLRDEGSVEAMFDATLAAYGRLDILDNNAAALGPEIARAGGDIERMETAVWDLAFAVNARGAMLCSRRALREMKSGGVIVNVASNLALQGHLIQAAYSASKAALIQMTRSIAPSHGRRGIRCNAVLPGLTVSPAALSDLPQALRKIVEAETPTPCLGSPEDIAEAVAFLASDAARYINGQCLAADGGTSIHVPGYAALRDFFGA